MSSIVSFLTYDLLVAVLEYGIVGSAVIYLIHGVDELVGNITFVIWRVVRWRYYQPQRVLTEELLDSSPEQLAMIMVPAWHEAGVIGYTLEDMAQRLRYKNYYIMVGCYPNDQDTIAVVQAAAAKYAHIHLVVLDHDGPTNKADCLNAIMAYADALELQTGRPIQIYVNNDAEDIVPAFELKVFNHLIPRKDVVQLPVFPLPAKWYQLTAGHYMDEFASRHIRDMRVREWVAKSIPTAGVGCGFSRRFIETARRHGKGQVFSTDSVTEDYEITLKLAKEGMNEIFINSAVIPAGGAGNRRWASMLPAVQEAFPAKFSAAVRQKSRWIMGITLQGWEHLGWSDNFLDNYIYVRDRKALFSCLAIVYGYLLFAGVLATWLVRSCFYDDTSFPLQISWGEWLWWLLAANLAFMLMQLGTRFTTTWIVYGPLHAVLSVPRAVWGNFINTAAAYRATAQYLAARRRNEVPAWDKTEHHHPGSQK